MAQTLNLENVQIGFRNFSGEKGMYNNEGERSFVVFLEPHVAADLEREGWNIKFPKPLDEPIDGDERQPYLPVKIGTNSNQTKIISITNEQPARIPLEDCGFLDFAEMDNIDIVINPYHYEVNGNKGVSAYLKSIYITLATDAFTQKYGI